MMTRQRSTLLLLSGCASLLPALALLFLLRAPLQPHATIILDGRADSGYGPALASDPDDLNSTIEGWIGTGWTEVISLYVTNDTRNLYVLVPLPAYSHTQSTGSYGLVIATGQYTATGGSAPTDPWGNAITFAYTATHANVGQAPTPLPYRIIPDFVLRGNIVGRDCCGMYDNGWSELRRWNGSNYSLGSGVNWGGLSGGTMVSERLAFADGEGLEFAIPLADLGLTFAPGALVHLQFFATQTQNTKGAYDTVPNDDQSAGWDDPTAQRFLATYLLVPAQDVTLLSPAEGTHVLSLPITVTGAVSPTGAVAVTLSVNDAHIYTPTLDSAGRFTQAVTLDPGFNTITATAVSSVGVGTDVRHVTYGPAAADGDIWWGCLGHFTRDEIYREPWGAIPTTATVALRLRACRDDLTGAALHVYLHNRGEVATLTMTRVFSDAAYDYWEAVATAPATPTLMYYKFEAIDGADHDWYVDDSAFDGRNGWGHAVDEDPIYDAFRITVYDRDFQTPDWLQNGVIYQIFPDRFRDGDPTNNVVSGTHVFYDNPHGGITYPTWNSPVHDPRQPGPLANRWSEDFYGGDLQGVTQQLDYLRGLGVTAIYLNPVFLSPSNHRYDTASYEQVDHHLGGDTALGALLSAAHARGMHVILDGVFNHTSSDSIYFDRYSHFPTLGAYESQNSPYFPWYRFNTWPNDYEMWWIYDTLPRLQSNVAAVRTYIYSGTNPIATRWLLFGADGWRLDVGGDIDGGAMTLSDGRSDYWEGFRSRVKAAAPQAAIIGEEWGDATYWLLGQEWDSVMNYRFRSALLSFLRDTPYTDNDNNPGSAGGPLNPITISQFDDRLHAIQEDYPPAAWYGMLNLVGSHDTNRVRFVLGHAQHADGSDLSTAELDARQGLLALLQFTLPGAPTVYYGDEVGLESPGRWYNSTWEDDPYNRAPYPWSDTPGYYQARPAVQALYARLGRIRGAHSALRTGSFDTLLTDDAHGVYAFGRRLEGVETAVVVVNRSAQARGLPVGTLVAVEGTVTAEPGIFKDPGQNRKLYLQDDTGGVLVYLASGLNPVARHNRVRVVGTTGEYRAETELLPLSAASVVDLGPGSPVPPLPRATGSVDESVEGQLVQVAGYIVAEPYVYVLRVNDGSGDVDIYRYYNLGQTNDPNYIDFTPFLVGDYVVVTGTTRGYDYSGTIRREVLPRGPADIRELYPVTFVYHDLEDVVHTNEEVQLRGDFNGWGATPITMAHDANYTVFTATVILDNLGTYDYKYYVPAMGDSTGWDLLNTNDRSVNVTTTGQRVDDYRNVVVGWAILQWPPSIAINLGQATGQVYGRVYIQNVTNPTGEGRGIHAQVGYGDSTDPAAWTWFPMIYHTDDGNNDEFMGAMTPPVGGIFSYTTRFDGNWGAGNPNAGWAYGDLDGYVPGGDPFELSQAGVLTVRTPDLSASSKTVAPAGQVLPGSLLTYTISLVNASGSGVTTATVHLTDTLPAEVTLVTATLPAGMTYAPDTHTLYWNGEVGIGETVELTFQVQVPALEALSPGA